MPAHTIGTDPATIAHIRDIHTLANRARALKAEIDDMKTLWNASLGANFNTNADTWDENRAGEGLVPVTSLQVSQVIGELFKVSTGGSAEWNSQIVSAMCVGSLQAN